MVGGIAFLLLASCVGGDRSPILCPSGLSSFATTEGDLYLLSDGRCELRALDQVHASFYGVLETVFRASSEDGTVYSASGNPFLVYSMYQLTMSSADFSVEQPMCASLVYSSCFQGRDLVGMVLNHMLYIFPVEYIRCSIAFKPPLFFQVSGTADDLLCQWDTTYFDCSLDEGQEAALRAGADLKILGWGGAAQTTGRIAFPRASCFEEIGTEHAASHRFHVYSGGLVFIDFSLSCLEVADRLVVDGRPAVNMNNNWVAYARCADGASPGAADLLACLAGLEFEVTISGVVYPVTRYGDFIRLTNLTDRRPARICYSLPSADTVDFRLMGHSLILTERESSCFYLPGTYLTASLMWDDAPDAGCVVRVQGFIGEDGTYDMLHKLDFQVRNLQMIRLETPFREIFGSDGSETRYQPVEHRDLAAHYLKTCFEATEVSHYCLEGRLVVHFPACADGVDPSFNITISTMTPSLYENRTVALRQAPQYGPAHYRSDDACTEDFFNAAETSALSVAIAMNEQAQLRLLGSVARWWKPCSMADPAFRFAATAHTSAVTFSGLCNPGPICYYDPWAEGTTRLELIEGSGRTIGGHETVLETVVLMLPRAGDAHPAADMELFPCGGAGASFVLPVSHADSCYEHAHALYSGTGRVYPAVQVGVSATEGLGIAHLVLYLLQENCSAEVDGMSLRLAVGGGRPLQDIQVGPTGAPSLRFPLNGAVRMALAVGLPVELDMDCEVRNIRSPMPGIALGSGAPSCFSDPALLLLEAYAAAAVLWPRDQKSCLCTATAVSVSVDAVGRDGAPEGSPRRAQMVFAGRYYFAAVDFPDGEFAGSIDWEERDGATGLVMARGSLGLGELWFSRPHPGEDLLRAEAAAGTLTLYCTGCELRAPYLTATLLLPGGAVLSGSLRVYRRDDDPGTHRYSRPVPGIDGARYAVVELPLPKRVVTLEIQFLRDICLLSNRATAYLRRGTLVLQVDTANCLLDSPSIALAFKLPGETDTPTANLARSGGAGNIAVFSAAAPAWVSRTGMREKLEAIGMVKMVGMVHRTEVQEYCSFSVANPPLSAGYVSHISIVAAAVITAGLLLAALGRQRVMPVLFGRNSRRGQS